MKDNPGTDYWAVELGEWSWFNQESVSCKVKLSRMESKSQLRVLLTEMFQRVDVINIEYKLNWLRMRRFGSRHSWVSSSHRNPNTVKPNYSLYTDSPSKCLENPYTSHKSKTIKETVPSKQKAYSFYKSQFKQGPQSANKLKRKCRPLHVNSSRQASFFFSSWSSSWNTGLWYRICVRLAVLCKVILWKSLQMCMFNIV